VILTSGGNIPFEARPTPHTNNDNNNNKQTKLNKIFKYL